MKKILILIIPFVISCKTNLINKNDCDENLIFKEKFFNHIENIKNKIAVRQDSTFTKSVIFVSNYAPVSFETFINYTISYPIGVFEKDKIKWEQWYEENKCKNIQLKNNYIIPEVYRYSDD